MQGSKTTRPKKGSSNFEVADYSRLLLRDRCSTRHSNRKSPSFRYRLSGELVPSNSLEIQNSLHQPSSRIITSFPIHHRSLEYSYHEHLFDTRLVIHRVFHQLPADHRRHAQSEISTQIHNIITHHSQTPATCLRSQITQRAARPR